MSNMSYCRFRNTLLDLQDCLEYISDDDISVEEKRAREKLIELCKEIVEETENVGEEEK